MYLSVIQMHDIQIDSDSRQFEQFGKYYHIIATITRDLEYLANSRDAAYDVLAVLCRVNRARHEKYCERCATRFVSQREFPDSQFLFPFEDNAIILRFRCELMRTRYLLIFVRICCRCHFSRGYDQIS